MIQFPGKMPMPTASLPLAAADVIEVAPKQYAETVSEHAGLVAGTWSSEAAHFFWTYYNDEVIFIVAGSALIRDVNSTIWRRVEAGHSVQFTLGDRAEWIVTDYVLKNFVIRKPSLLRSAIARARRFITKNLSPIPVRHGESI